MLNAQISSWFILLIVNLLNFSEFLLIIFSLSLCFTSHWKNSLPFLQVRGILNKLTPEKFQKLSDDLLHLNLNSSKILNGVILLIFEKALDEPKYSSMYAQLCKRLSKEAPSFADKDEPCTFLRLLLNVCRDKFQNRAEYAEKIYQVILFLSKNVFVVWN